MRLVKHPTSSCLPNGITVSLSSWMARVVVGDTIFEELLAGSSALAADATCRGRSGVLAGLGTSDPGRIQVTSSETP